MRVGKVYLIGAGPGDPGLITVKGQECLAQADVVVYDRLVNERIMRHMKPGSELIYVGKASRDHTLRQDEINALLAQRAKEGKVVARLKGGDPFVFGRGGEEAEVLIAEGIPCEVVPGVTSAIAAPAYAGIPVTHRSYNSSFAVITGHEDPTKATSSIDWSKIATGIGTLIFLMGTENLPHIVNGLVQHGRSPQTPVALVRWGTWPQQRTVVGTLEDIVEKVREAGFTSPAVTIVGEVVELREKLRWFDNRPLFGKRVLVTRTRSQASALSELLAALGAEPVELPTIEIKELDDYSRLDEAISRLPSYQWTVFTSANAVEVFFRRLRAQGKDARAFVGVRLCAIGPGTARALERYGLMADLMPKEYIAEGAIAALSQQGIAGARILIPRAEVARPELVMGLTNLGAKVDEVAVYQIVVPAEAKETAQSLLDEGVDVVTFTSSSTVRNLVSILDSNVDALSGAVTACIGPITAATAKELGLRVDIVSEQHDIPGLVDALLSWYQGRREEA